MHVAGRDASEEAGRRARGGFLVVSAGVEAGQELRRELGAASGRPTALVSSLAGQPSETMPHPSVTIIWVAPADVVANVVAARRFGHPTIIVAGDAPANVTFEAARVGADALVTEPVSADRLLAVIRGMARPSNPTRSMTSLARAEWEYIQVVLALYGGNRSATARHLNIHRSVLQRKLSRTPPGW
jgi:DNA-binding NtrC family response regulator